ncbi:cap-specific mRNA (nucleoside-2'-O-)-methyltransferase 2 [Bactrocera neohumeralis]|uniref:cap-specific mRNA (nucleoside-2'-O-)-methyltransferase 2 n=1 Tax=Bactrocera neohumeralis TaxID=98809 RepID=UPI0021651DFE|nr:cap-specific mRNA (nucleoside-2'-O-)-methyltransferase 2 [Bactrocera neohumeralis]XP_050326336.1 cap-specific mRNA (nucleoside-2'-O-)-methyltransferase 2 [Bactrocera neohumeralis]
MENTTQRLIPRSGLLQVATNYNRPSKEHFRYESRSDNNKPSKMEVNRVFEKKFHYQKPKENTWQLPSPNEAFSEYYQFDTLQQLKPKLNDVKCKLNNYTIEDWSLHTRRQDPSNEIPWRLKNETKAEFVTVAWCKLFECLHAYPLVKGPHLNSLHLCELPGAFIAALNHYMYSTYKKEEVEWRWLSTTLNPYYEGNPTSGMITDDRFMFHTFDNWLMHDDFTGNIINRNHIEQMQEHCRKRLEDNVQLITADGSIDCVDAPDCQEEVVATLHFAELTAALCILADGGCFVVKMFTMFESTNVCKLFLLNCVFEEVHVFKPATSKRGNSEIYIICIGYRKQTKYLPELLQLMKENVGCANILPLFPRSYLPNDFFLQHEICARLFMNFQIEAIEANIQTYEVKPTRRQVIYKQHFRTETANEFYARYKVCSIAEQNKVLYGHQATEENCKSAPFCRGSYTEREMAKETTMEERIFSFHRYINNLEKILDFNYDIQFQDEYDTSNTSTPELHIYRGAPFTELLSSLFAHPYVMQLHQKLKDMLNRDPIYMLKPNCIADGEEIHLNLNMHGYSLLPREYFIRLLDTIYEKQTQRLVLSNVVFLTHLSVSVLLSLALFVFGHLSISTGSNFQIELLAKCDKYTQDQMSTLKRIRDLLTEDANVLGIMPIEKLHRNKFANTLMAYNNQLLMKNFKLALDN